MYKAQRNYENIQKALYEGVGSYRIPEIKPTHYDNCEWIGFNYAKSATDRECKGVHFFLDDYQFIRVWTNIDQYIPMLQQFKFVKASSRGSESLFETMTEGRVYVTVGGNELLRITYFDEEKKRQKQIDINHTHKGIKPHVHHGYNHNEKDGLKGAAGLMPKEKVSV